MAGGDAVSSYAGQTVNLLFYVTTDPLFGYLTSFFITDVSLVAATTADIPANDNFTNATVILSDNVTEEVATTYASKESGEPDIAGNEGGHSVWWTWTASAIGTVTIATTGSSFDTLLGVFTGSSIGALTVVTNSDGFNRSTGLALLTFAATPGTHTSCASRWPVITELRVNANFIFKFTKDSTRPTVTIKSPVTGTDVTNSTVQVAGTASDNVAVASVYYQVKNANGSANAWQAQAEPTLGPPPLPI